ncbi:DNA glycosylase [Avibacterium paragallinarum]|uniref:DNA glycosylase n=3 Tax=Avibacterium paragallinarum TaxID=728 RepID=A0AAE5TKR7_AVIPA|nr:DNA glycosylase [Avibacterium paragallinarum]PXZ39538.1 DNA glycosylase [Avibacterium paragallinarum]PXZ42533.1 DNA glycosylase [Avibacterium paragallinarum]QZP16314.1 DNA glycosylase [Avibacterium paragallinarum]WAL57367.1 DNA glycosylase [Avibacterium paragallinarum]WAM60323.1 DNA glycosylase [Avibacterium paragallinarum]
MSQQIETHPFPAILPPHATVMMMGSFPPKEEKRCMEFHYPNFQNDMWRVYGAVFFGRADYFQVPNEKRFDAERIKQFLWDRGIALCPTVRKAIRLQDNASDKFLKVVETVNLSEVLPQVPHCNWIFTTGGKATEILLSLLPEKVKEPKTNSFIPYPYPNFTLNLYRLPSTSRAYPLAFEKKVAAYCAFFKKANII